MMQECTLCCYQAIQDYINNDVLFILNKMVANILQDSALLVSKATPQGCLNCPSPIKSTNYSNDSSLQNYSIV